MLAMKYAPSDFSDLLTNSAQAKRAFEAVKSGKNVIIEGPTGCGKTSSVRIIARKLNYQIVDMGRMGSVQMIESGSQKPMFYDGKLIVFEDFETFRNKQMLRKVAESSSWPVVVTTSDIYSSGLYSISGFEKIKFRPVRKDVLARFLRKVAASEGISISDTELMIISDMSNGDVRAALNSLESASLGHRDHSIDIFRTLALIFASKTVSSVMSAMNLSEKDMYEILRWIYANIHSKMLFQNLAKALDVLSKMDTMLWRGMSDRFVPAFVAEAVSHGKKEGFVRFSPPKFRRQQKFSGVHMSSRKIASDRLLRTLLLSQ